MAKRSKQKVDELRALSETDLTKELDEAHRQLFIVRIQLTTRQISNTAEPRRLKHKIARIKTVQRERELTAGARG
jgi:large subunit ribosomal protein L29